MLFRTMIAASCYNENDQGGSCCCFLYTVRHFKGFKTSNNLGDHKSMKNLPSTIVKIFLLLSFLSMLGCNALAPATPTTTATSTTAPTVDPLILTSTVSAAKTESVA